LNSGAQSAKTSAMLRFTWVLFLASSLEGYPSSIPPLDRAMGQLDKTIQDTLSAVHKKAATAGAEKQREEAIRNRINGLWRAFFADSFIDHAVSMEDHAKYVRVMWDHLKKILLENSELIQPDIAQIFLSELDAISLEVKSRDAKKQSAWLYAYSYSIPETMLLEAPALGVLFLGKKAVRSVRGLRAGVRFGSKEFWSEWNLMNDLRAWRASRSDPAGGVRPVRNLGALCKRGLRWVGDRKKWGFVGRHLLIAGVYSVPNYFFRLRPLFWGFNDYEPWDFSEDLISKEIRPFFQERLK
jgi:hypothetical protein